MQTVAFTIKTTRAPGKIARKLHYFERDLRQCREGELCKLVDEYAALLPGARVAG